MDIKQEAPFRYLGLPSRKVVTQAEYDNLVRFLEAIEVGPVASLDQLFVVGHRSETGEFDSSEQGVDLDGLKRRGIYQVAANPQISGVRDYRGPSYSVYFDESFDQTAAYDKWSGRYASSQRLEHGMLRGGAFHSRLSGDTYQYGWPSSLSKAIVAGHPRIKVEL